MKNTTAVISALFLFCLTLTGYAQNNLKTSVADADAFPDERPFYYDGDNYYYQEGKGVVIGFTSTRSGKIISVSKNFDKSKEAEFRPADGFYNTCLGIGNKIYSFSDNVIGKTDSRALYCSE